MTEAVPLDEAIQLELLDSLKGGAPQQYLNVARPTAAGLTWLAVPTACVGLAFRISNGTTLEAIAFSPLQVKTSVELSAPAVNLACSSDGRLIVVACSDGSLQCYNATSTSLSLRWSLPNAHSHVVSDISKPVSSSRDFAATRAGPIHSLAFAPTGYAFLMADAGTRRLSIFHANSATPDNIVDNSMAGLEVLCAAWSSRVPPDNDGEFHYCAGLVDASVHIYSIQLDTGTTKLVSTIAPLGDQAMDGFVPTHLDWSLENGTSLAIGYCRCDVYGANDDEEAEDDAADHDAALYIGTMNENYEFSNASDELEDVVPFFSVPRLGRHVFFSAFCSPLLFVASNVASEVGVVVLDHGVWQKIDLQEGFGASCPTDEDDEFTFPMGISTVLLPENSSTIQALLLVSTDGSLSTFSILNQNDEHAFSTAQTSIPHGVAALPATPVETVARSFTPPLSSEPEEEESPANQAEAFPTSPAPVFGSGASSGLTFGSGTAAPAFGQPSSLGAASTTPSSTFASPPASSASAFGSGGAVPTFGSGGAVPAFGSSGGGGFAALAASPAATPGGFGSASPFGAFAKPTSSTPSSMVKPLFGDTPSKPVVETKDASSEETPSDKGTMEASVPLAEETTIDMSSPAAEKAARVFDSFDDKKSGTLPLEVFEDLMDELGEGIHGDELEAQKALVDPDGNKKVTRAAFISWYINFISSDGNDNDSLDSEDLAEREEEKRVAEEKFASLATPGDGGKPAIKTEQFQDLIEKFGTVYCEEEHSKTIEKLVKSDGMIYEDDFITWYMKWLFEDESSDEEEDRGDEDASTAPSSSNGWGDIFGDQATRDTWKCDICSVPNDLTATKCVACETPKPGLAAEDDTTTALPETSTVSGSSIGPGGFSFGGTSAGASGFSFGSAPTATTPGAPKTEDGSKPSGFSFGGGAAPTGGFSFGSPSVSASATTNVAKAQGGFSFGAAPMATSATTEEGEQKPAPTMAATKPTGAGNPGEKKAADVFDSFDENKAGTLPLEVFEDMMDEIGEGIHGDELEAQKALVDPDGNKKVTRAAFISWYSKLLTSADDDSLSTVAREEREEEKRDAEELFGSLATQGEGGKPAIKREQFQDLIEKFGTVYCEEEHSKTSEKLVKSDGMIYEDDFITWYMKWLFEDESSDEEEEDNDDGEEDITSVGGSPNSSKGWGNIFSNEGEEDTWKCDICMVRNDKSATKCVSCETPKPGVAQSDEAAVPETSTVSGSSIGPGGFSFGGTSPGASGFSFGSTTFAGPKTEGGLKPSGFSFGGTAAPAASGFSFGNSFKAPSASTVGEASSGGDSEAKNSGTQSGEASKPEMSISAATTAPSSKAKASPAYPPISTKAPSPFGGTKVAAPSPAKSTASSAYPPMSSKPPVPFGGGKSKPTTVSSTSGSAAFPPLSSKGPSPFSAAKPKESSSPSTSGSAAFPPMSSTAPSPFSAPKTTGSAAFPPLSSTAPSPFSAPKTTGSAAFPPMSSTAPSPFSAPKSKESPVSKATGSAAFPPLSSTAPSPFSALKPKETAPPREMGLGSAAFQPLSSKAPSPFSAAKPKESASSSTSGSAAFPPMSSKAPSPFSAVKSKESPVSNKATGSAAFPPLSSQAPKPFGGIGGSQAPPKPLGTSSFPPLSSRAPKPFGGTSSASTSGTSAAPLFSSSALKTPPSTGIGKVGASLQMPIFSGASTVTGSARASASSPWKKPAASDYESQFRDVVEKFQKSISSLAGGRLSQEGDAKFEREIENLVREKDSIVTSCTDVRLKITKQKERSIFLLSRKTDIERQTSECRRQIHIQEKSHSDQADVIEKQPLDAESERSRRSIAVKALMVNKTLELLENRTSLLRGVCKIDDENATEDSVSFSERDRRNILFQAVTSSFQNTKSFEEGVARAHNRVVGYTESFPAFPSDLVSTPVSQSRPSSRGNLSGRKSRHRLTPVSLGVLTSNTPSSRSTDVRDKTEKWSRIEQAVRRTKSKSSVVPVKKLTRLSRIGASTKSSSQQNESITARPLGPSLLLSPTDGVPLISTTKTTQEKRITFSSPLSKLRPDWNVDSNVDQEKMKGLSLGFPQHLNKIDAAEASRQALSGFGTTPEKSERAFELKKSSTSAGTAKSSAAARSSRSSSAAAFPPMPTKAPTPFSAGKSSDKGSSQTKQSSAYPPVAAKAPKPFSSSGTGSKPTELKSETSKPPSLQPKTSFPTLSRSPAGEKNTPAFGDLKGLGDSLFAAESSSSPEKSESDALGLSLGTSLSSDDSSSGVKSDAPDYRSILIQFYTTHNPSRLNEVNKTLEKYKGREVEMFGKLGRKYNVPSPLESTLTAPAAAPPSTAFGSTPASPFSTPVAPMPSSSNTTSAFGSTATDGAPSPSPFGASASQPSSIGPSPFGKPAASPFGSTPSPFGPPATSQASPFGQPAAPQPAVAPTSTTLIGGREPREVLVAFYQKYNQSRLGEVDKVLLKYKGNEEQLFRNLARKYNLDPTIFGLSPTPPASAAPFGQASTSGGFGQTSQPFGAPSTPGFGQTSSLSGGGSAAFGSPSPAPAFGSPSAIGGGQSTFGSMAQQPGTQQTTPFGGSGMQQAGGFGSLSSGSTSGFGGGGAFGGGAAPSASANPFGAPRR